jgi:hypothetical protein
MRRCLARSAYRVTDMKKNIIILVISLVASFSCAYAATNINTQGTQNEKWGWNDVFGWIDMASTTSVFVGTSTIAGYASSSIGDIMFDCATTRSGNTCATSNFKTANDGTGLLSGWAWNDIIGWISMSGTTAAPSNTPYGVSITAAGDNVNSYFHGWAWNDVVGWLTFNCNDYGASFCTSTSTYKTQTGAGAASTGAEFTSSIFDIGTSSGLFNTLTWKGSQPAGTSVKFQIATANATSTLTGATSTVFAASTWFDVNQSPASPVRLSKNAATGYVATGVEVENRRYIRYRAALSTDGASGLQIDDIIINWSP